MMNKGEAEMSDKYNTSEVLKSVAAVKEYIRFRQGKRGWHQALVLSPASEKAGCGDLLSVLAEETDNSAKITIDWTNSYISNCNSGFTSAECIFCIRGRTLQIKAKDALECPITIEITAVE